MGYDVTFLYVYIAERLNQTSEHTHPSPTCHFFVMRTFNIYSFSNLKIIYYYKLNILYPKWLGPEMLWIWELSIFQHVCIDIPG